MAEEDVELVGDSEVESIQGFKRGGAVVESSRIEPQVTCTNRKQETFSSQIQSRYLQPKQLKPPPHPSGFSIRSSSMRTDSGMSSSYYYDEESKQSRRSRISKK
jgi:hypothetical protein